MHSSPLLFASEFQATRHDPARPTAEPVALADAFADYHSQDRVVIIANRWEDTFVQNAAGITALTAMFYDAQRATGKPFYTYPSHFLLICEGPDGIKTRTGVRPLAIGAAGRPWGHLDVWPETQWIGVAPDTGSLLKAVFALHAHRLFWPEDLFIAASGAPLPSYMRLILGSRLKAVYLYNTASPNLRIGASARAREMLEITPKLFASDFAPPTESKYRSIDSEAFLTLVDGCFEKSPHASGAVISKRREHCPSAAPRRPDRQP